MIRVVDISRAQGPFDFAKLRLAGVQGVIMRICHGLTLDTMVDTYYPAALAAGYQPDDIGFYPFINPKRGSATETALFAAAEIRRITGSDAFFYMLDIENYRDQSPNVGYAPLVGAPFAAYIAEHTTVFHRAAPDTVIIGYTNQAFWNSALGPNDHTLAAEYEWIVPRYPVNSTLGYVKYPLPAPIGWEQWAFARAPDGPYPPVGASWSGWQFSAGYNRQGVRYGASSTDLDLNIIHPDAWARWTSRVTPNPPPEDDMATRLVVNRDTGKYGPAYGVAVGGYSVFKLIDNAEGVATKKALGLPEYYANGYINGTQQVVPVDDATLDSFPLFAPDPLPPIVIPPITLPPLTGQITANLGAQGKITGVVG